MSTSKAIITFCEAPSLNSSISSDAIDQINLDKTFNSQNTSFHDILSLHKQSKGIFLSLFIYSVIFVIFDNRYSDKHMDSIIRAVSKIVTKVVWFHN